MRLGLRQPGAKPCVMWVRGARGHAQGAAVCSDAASGWRPQAGAARMIEAHPPNEFCLRGGSCVFSPFLVISGLRARQIRITSDNFKETLAA